MTRGEVWWAKLPLPAGRRPVVLVSREASYAIRAAVTVVEVSTLVRGIPSEVRLGPRDGLPRPCAANADNLVTIPKIWLESCIAALPRDKIDALDVALGFALGLPLPPEPAAQRRRADR
jgi:mRNA interferase MazF